MLELNTIKLDPAKLSAGSWWKVWREPDGSIGGEPVYEAKVGDSPAVLVVPQGIAYERVQEEERKPHLEAIRLQVATDDTKRDIYGRTLGRAVLRGWRNLTVGGALLPWSEAKAIELMTDEKWSALREFVGAAAKWKAAAAAREEEQAAGN